MPVALGEVVLDTDLEAVVGEPVLDLRAGPEAPGVRVRSAVPPLGSDLIEDHELPAGPEGR